MKILFTAFMFLFLLSCATTPAVNFTPTTMEGAVCKRDCANRKGMCGNYISCLDGYDKCMLACMDIDRLGKK